MYQAVGTSQCHYLLFVNVFFGDPVSGFSGSGSVGTDHAAGFIGCGFFGVSRCCGKMGEGLGTRILMMLLMAAAPFVMLIAVERLNGNFITEFLIPKEDIWENYVVYLLLYIAVFAVSGSVRVSVMTVSPVLLLFGIANMYVKEFKGSPLVPMDFSSIKTAGNVAAGYTCKLALRSPSGSA